MGRGHDPEKCGERLYVTFSHSEVQVQLCHHFLGDPGQIPSPLWTRFPLYRMKGLAQGVSRLRRALMPCALAESITCCVLKAGFDRGQGAALPRGRDKVVLILWGNQI